MLKSYLSLLYFSVAIVYREFFMYFYQIATGIINFLIKFNCFFQCVNFFDISCFPSVPTFNCKPVFSSARG